MSDNRASLYDTFVACDGHVSSLADGKHHREGGIVTTSVFQTD